MGSRGPHPTPERTPHEGHYHGRAGSLDLPRTLRIDRLSWTVDERPSLDGPSTDIRTAPTP